MYKPQRSKFGIGVEANTTLLNSETLGQKEVTSILLTVAFLLRICVAYFGPKKV